MQLFKVFPLDRVFTAPQFSEEYISKRNVEQHVDIPVPGRGGRIDGLQGFLPEQSSTALHVSQGRISGRIVEQIVDFPVSGGGLQDFRPGQSSSSSLHFPAGVHEVLDEPGEGFFSHFSQNKKGATLGPHSGSELSADFTSSTPAAHVDSWVDGDDVWIRINSVQGPCWTKLLSDHRQCYPPWEGH